MTSINLIFGLKCFAWIEKKINSVPSCRHILEERLAVMQKQDKVMTMTPAN